MSHRTTARHALVPAALALTTLAACAGDATAPSPTATAALAAPQLPTPGPLAIWQRTQGPAFVHAFLPMAAGAVLAGSEEGIFRSGDDGRSWTAVEGLPEGMATASLAGAPGGTLYAGSFGGAGVFRSTDGGARWEHAGLAGADVRAVGVDGEGRVYAGASGFEGGIFRSDDAGATWTLVLPPLNRRDFIVTGLSFWKSDVYLTTHADDAWHGVSGGEQWSFLGGLYATPEYLAPALEITALPTGALLAAHAGGILRSVDGGASWKSALTGPGTQWIVADAAGAAYAYTWQGTVYRSTDDGVTWTPVVRARRGLYATAFGVTPGGAMLLTTDEGMFRAESR